MAELQNVAVQLSNVAEKTDAATRGRFHPEHQKLTDDACVIEQKASEREPAVTGHIERWQKFNQQLNDVCVILDELDNKLPASVDVTRDMLVLRQQLKDCRDADDKLQSEMTRINDVMQQGRVILEHVNSSIVQAQVDNLSDRVNSLTEKINSNTQRYLSVLWICL